MSSLVHLEFFVVKKLIAVPLCPARPHRPMRWTYDWGVANIRPGGVKGAGEKEDSSAVSLALAQLLS